MSSTGRDTKFNADLLKRAVAWVVERGLYPEPHGATIRSFCKAMGISEDSHARWVKRYADYAEAIKKANEAFSAALVLRLESTLIERATGNVTRKKTRTRMIADEDGNPVVSEKIIDEEQMPPDTTAIIFALKNIAPEKWKDKQLQDVALATPIIIQSSERGIKAMEKLNELGNE